MQKRQYSELQRYGSPAYFFEEKILCERVENVKNMLGRIPLTFSMKANPFLLSLIIDEVKKIEVCSPGELHICKAMGIPGENIIYSGVNKEEWDIREAVDYGAGILTAESLQQIRLENQVVKELNCPKKRVLLRLTSGNQFGMSEQEIEDILSKRERLNGVNIIGIHYYSGTQKKIRSIKKDLQYLSDFLKKMKDEYQFQPELVEYGPGIGAEYFLDSMEACEQKEMDILREAAASLKEFAKDYPLGVEMGRFLAAPCGTYLTQVKDVKSSCDTNYLILDGGIHQLKYYGQTMAMQVPPIFVIRKVDRDSESMEYMLCGSLCTTADVLVREVHFPEVQIGDYLQFHRCGAYSVTEGAVSFLSRTMPRIYLISKDGAVTMVRDFMETSDWNQKRKIK